MAISLDNLWIYHEYNYNIVANDNRKYNVYMSNVIDGKFCGGEINLAKTIQNIQNHDSIKEIVLVALTDQDKLQVFYTCSDEDLPFMLIDAAEVVEPTIFLDDE